MCNEEKSGFLNYRNHLITHFNFDPLINGNKCAMCHKVCRDRADAKRHMALKHKWLQLQLYIEYGIDYDCVIIIYYLFIYLFTSFSSHGTE